MVYFVERKRIELTPGMMLYVPPFALRFLHPDSSGYDRFFITFEVSGQQPYLPEPGVFDLSENNWKSLRVFLDEFNTGSAVNASLALMDFLNGQRTLRHDAASESDLPENLLRVIEQIETSLADVPDISPLASKAGLSESHLRALFRKHMGVSIGRFITGKKIDFARYALSNSDMSIAEIAEAAGFNNIYVFSTFFKRNTGSSPLRFRKEMSMTAAAQNNT
jgi:AraC-like DNA-binding protein